MNIHYQPMKYQNCVLVTGAAQRIGRSIALGFAKRKWFVVIHYHLSRQAADDLVHHIHEMGGKALAVRADLSDIPETEELIKQTNRVIGQPITCLVNNASIFERDEAGTVTNQSWQRHLQINLHAPFILSQEFYRQLPPKIPGHIINIIDQRVLCLTPYFTSYTVSKSALWTLTQTLALAWAPYIRVNAIGPGPTLPSVRQTPQQFEEQYSAMPLQRAVTPEEISHTVQFLIDTPSITGQMIALDSGQHLGWNNPPKKDMVME